ncbi:hypothetical protein D3C71_2113240 [compost metagenome]
MRSSEMSDIARISTRCLPVMSRAGASISTSRGAISRIMSTNKAPVPRVESKLSDAMRSGRPTRGRSVAIGTFSTQSVFLAV